MSQRSEGDTEGNAEGGRGGCGDGREPGVDMEEVKDVIDAGAEGGDIDICSIRGGLEEKVRGDVGG